MNIKKLNEELKKFLESATNFKKFKQVYPKSFKQDLKDEYIDLLMKEVSPGIGNKEKIENYKNSVTITKEVSYPKETAGYLQYLIFGYYYNESLLRGEITLYVREDNSVEERAREEVFAGFVHNPIGQIKNVYTLNAEYVLNNETNIIEKLISDMAAAIKSSRKADKAYIDYVERTGDLS